MKNRKNTRIIFFCTFLCLLVTINTSTKSNFKTDFCKSSFNIFLPTSTFSLIFSGPYLFTRSSSDKLNECNFQQENSEQNSLVNAVCNDNKIYSFIRKDDIFLLSTDLGTSDV